MKQYTDAERRRAEAWIRKKERQGVDRRYLRETVGMFSNKKREKAMAQKNLNSKQYAERFAFLRTVYLVLSEK